MRKGQIKTLWQEIWIQNEKEIWETIEKFQSKKLQILWTGYKDQDVSRNLPGKVKISAPQLQKSKAKAKNS